MARYLTLRVLQAAWVLWAAFTISFVVLYLLPADPISIAADGAGAGTPVDKAAIAELQARYGLDRPLWEQYWTALGHAVHGDLGHSIVTGQPVTDAIGDALPSTLGLAGLALLFATIGGVALALAATYTRRPWLRTALGALPSLGCRCRPSGPVCYCCNCSRSTGGLLPPSAVTASRARYCPR